jgi:hypothetical protein
VFQIQAVDSTTGDSAGFFVYGPGLRVVRPPTTTVFRNRRYLEHGGDTSSVQEGRLGPVEWSFQWTAPTDAAARKVYFFAAGNAANGDGCAACEGDFIFTDAESTTSAMSTSIARKTWGAIKTLYRGPSRGGADP